MAVQELLVRLGLDNSSFSKKIKGVKTELNILDKNFEAITASTKNFGKTQEDLAQKTSYLQEKMSHLNVLNQELANEYSSLGEKIKEAKDKVSFFNDALKTSNNTYEQTSSLVSQYGNEVKDLSSKLKTTEGNLELLNKEFESSSKVLQEQEDAYNAINESYQKTSKEVEGLTKTLKNQQISISRNTTEMNKKVKANEELKESASKLETKIESLTKSYDKNKAELDKANQKLKENVEKYGEGARWVVHYEEKVKQLTNTQNELESELLQSKNELSNINKQISENDSKIQSYSTKIDELKNSQKQYREELEKLKPELANLAKEEEEARIARDKQQKTVDALRESHKKLSQQYEEEKKAYDQANDNYQKAQKSLEYLSEEVKSYTQQLDKAERDLERYNIQLQNVEKELADVEVQQKKTNMALKDVEIEKAQLNMRNYAESLEKTGGVLQSIGGSLQSVGSTLTYGLSMPLVGLGTLVGNTFGSFEERIRKVNAVFGGNAEDMEEQFEFLSESARKFGRETEWTAEQVGEAYEYMATAGWSVEKSTESMSALLKLASIDMLDLGTASDIVTDTMTPFTENLEKIGKEVEATGQSFNDAEFMVDIFAQTANKTNTNVTLMGETFKYAGSISAEAGADFRDVAVAVGMMANSGVKGSMAGTSLAQGITRLLSPTESASALMDEFGIQVARNADGGMDLQGTILNLQTAFQGMSKETQVANAKVIFGQTALKGWLPLVTATADEYNELTESIYNCNGASDLFMEEMSKSGAYQFKIMTSAIQDFLIVVGDALAPAFKDVAEKVGEMATKLSDWVSKMKETDPELLALIGKMALMAVVVPPAITILGKFTSGIGGIYSAIGGGLNKFLDFKKATMEVANGTRSAEKHTSLLAQGVGGLISKFGLAKVAIAGGVAVLGGLAIALGENEDALSWMQDKWGTFGVFVGGICENLNGWFKLVFGNLGNLIMGVGKSIGAIVTGNWRDIDDIWRETWADIENTTAKAMSNINMESTGAIRQIREASEKELSKLEESFEVVYANIYKLTADNYKDVAKNLVKYVDSLDKKTIEIMKGTSDSMAVMFDGIYDSMSQDKVLKQLEENLESMAKSGKYSAEELQKDFEKAFELIRSNASTGAQQVGEEVTKITRHISRLSQDGYDNVAKNIAGTLKSMDEATFTTLSGLGETWQTLFAGVEFGSKNMNETILNNLQNMGEDTSAIIDALNSELQNGFDETGKRIEGINEQVQGTTQTTAEAFGTMVDVIKNNSATGMDEVANIFATGLQTLDVETLNSLKNTSDHWYSILDGTTTESGELVDNFAQQIMWNLGWVAQQTPEKLEGFKTGLLDALVQANLITSDEMTAIVQTIEEKTDEAVANAEGTGEEIKDNVVPKNSAEKVTEELDAISGAIAEKTAIIAEESAKAGESAQQQFDQKVSDLGKDIQIDPNIIDAEYLGTQFQNAGTLAVQNFAMGWSNNSSIINEAIQLSLDTISLDMTSKFESLNLNIDGVVQKTTILTNEITKLRSGVSLLNTTDLTSLLLSLNNTKDALKNIYNNSNEAKRGMQGFANSSIVNLHTNLNIANTRLKDIQKSTQVASNEMKKLSSRSMSSLLSQLERVRSGSEKAKSSFSSLGKAIDKVVGKSFRTMHSNIDTISYKVNTAISNTNNLKYALYDLNNVSFYGLISRLSDLRYWLNSVNSTARSAYYSVSSVNRARMIEEPVALTLSSQMAQLSRESLTLERYQTRGGYYSPNSMAGTGSQAREVESQKEQLNLLSQQNELLRQLLLATTNIGGDLNVSVELDGRSVAKGTAKYMEKEINQINKRKTRLGMA